jgi:DNA polymerase
VLGRAVTIAKVRGEILQGQGDSRVLVTIHPSYLLRIQGENNLVEKVEAYQRFVEDLRVCARVLRVVG